MKVIYMTQPKIIIAEIDENTQYSLPDGVEVFNGNLTDFLTEFEGYDS